jgi:penicillin-binding protein-related factor A (putative recombinase)
MTGAFELKQTNDKAIPYSALADHQEQALLNVKNNHLVFKIPDAGYQNPFDCFCLKQTPAFVVLFFGLKRFYLIDIDNFVFYRDNKAKRKSITEEEADRICHLWIKL